MDPIALKDILFIINPYAGRRKVEKLPEKLRSVAPEVSCIITYDLSELEAIFREKMDRYRAFIVAGGDGTVHEAMKYLYNRKDKLFGVFPTGSGNGFARELGFRKSIIRLLTDALNGGFTDIDILSINDDMCINVAGIGYDSHVAHHFQESKDRGLLKYIALSVRSIFTFKPFNAVLMVDGYKVEGLFHMITIANTRQFGNNAIISPLSRPDDGIFELVLVRPFPWYLYPEYLVKMFNGSLSDSRYLKFMKVRDRVEITSGSKQYHIDGEPKTFRDSLTVKMLPGKVRVVKTRHVSQ